MLIGTMRIADVGKEIRGTAGQFGIRMTLGVPNSWSRLAPVYLNLKRPDRLWMSGVFLLTKSPEV